MQEELTMPVYIIGWIIAGVISIAIGYGLAVIF